MTRFASLAAATAPARRAYEQARNRWAEPGFTELAARRGITPKDGVAVFFASTPLHLYQFEQWRLPLEHLNRRVPVFVVVTRPDTGRRLLDTTNLPVALARGSLAQEQLVAKQAVRAVLYVNQTQANFQLLRQASPVHVHMGHGESDKAYSVSNQLKAYDYVLVGGEAGRQRLQSGLRGFDARSRTLDIGRPQLDYRYPGAPDWPADRRLRVWYAPTWEGDRPGAAYGSVASHGLAIVETLRAEADVRILYRPHPSTGQLSRAHAETDRAIRAVLAADGDRHLVDRGAYGWQWDFADACITDISSVAYDWLATRKPLVVTEPQEPQAFRPASRLLETLPLLKAGEAGTVAERIRALRNDPADTERLAALSAHYFGDVSDGRSTERFERAVDQVLAAY